MVDMAGAVFERWRLVLARVKRGSDGHGEGSEGGGGGGEIRVRVSEAVPGEAGPKMSRSLRAEGVSGGIVISVFSGSESKEGEVEERDLLLGLRYEDGFRSGSFSIITISQDLKILISQNGCVWMFGFIISNLFLFVLILVELK
eukprot:TRINITY_DN18585_c0_g1_i1.p2 TRINITY_DN18585_c0_g1~~TRINITY_DN18585_c0_g1_i1.p2  ORF type:complete len:144 (-),score=15.00 TRINITY_DN18585_c0_g1_i1:541-972(-)